MTTMTTKELTISFEYYNCHGYKESIEYILSRMYNTDFMCLTETWIKPSENSLIQQNINDHIISKDNYFVVFNKSGMWEDDEHSAGRPYSGVCVICRVIKGLSYELIQCASDNPRIIRIMIKDRNDNLINLIICTYMPYYEDSKPNLTDEYVSSIDDIQAMIDGYGDTVPIKNCW